MALFTDYADQKIMELLFGKTAFTPPATYYVALSTTVPTQVKGAAAPYWNFTEPGAGKGYTRIAVTNNGTHFGAIASEPTDGFSVTNLLQILFGTPSAAWGDIEAIGFFDAEATGNLIAIVALTSAKTVPAGATPPQIAAKALTLTNN